MSLKDIGEFGFIDRISRGCLIRPAGVVKAIGDDAAAFRSAPERLTLVTTDLLVERVHFLREAGGGNDLGHKALAVNLSDIAAMGGDAAHAFVSLAIPEDCQLDYLDDLYQGMRRLAAEFGVNILGGDTTGSKADLIINITVTGTVAEDEILFRNGAQAGDVIFCTGWLGDSRAGLHLVQNRIAADNPDFEQLLKAHLRPHPFLREGRFLASGRGVHAAIDVSDGLSSDLGHILRNSRVGAVLTAERLPVSPALKRFCRRFSCDPVEYALAGGEDYSLLVTVDPAAADPLARDYRATFGRPLYRFGTITASDKMELIGIDGEIRPVAATGWNHFRPNIS